MSTPAIENRWIERIRAEMARRGVKSVGGMASLLGMDRSYLSQILNNHRSFSEQFQRRLEHLENETGLNNILLNESNDRPVERCRRHFDQLIQACNGDPGRLFWVLEQLRIHLPVDRWASQDAQPTDEQLNEAAITGLAQLGGNAAIKALGLPERPKKE